MKTISVISLIIFSIIIPRNLTGQISDQNPILVSIFNPDGTGASQEEIVLLRVVDQLLSVHSARQTHMTYESVSKYAGFTRQYLQKENTTYSFLLPTGPYQPRSDRSYGRVMFIKNLTLFPKPGNQGAEAWNACLAFDFALWNNETRKLMDFSAKMICVPVDTVDVQQGEKIAAVFHQALTPIAAQKAGKNASSAKTYIGLSEWKSNENDISLLFTLSPHINFHLPQKDEDNPGIPNQYENPQEYPSIHNFFSDGLSGTFSAEALFYKYDYILSGGLEYNYESLSEGDYTLVKVTNEYPSSQTITIHSVGPTFGYYKRFNPNAYWFIKGRLWFVNYSGKSEFNAGTVTSHYDQAVMPGLSFGFMAGRKYPVTGEVGISIGSTQLTKLTATGYSESSNFKLYDNRLFFKLGIGYNLLIRQGN